VRTITAADGTSACANRLTIRATIADAALLAGSQAKLRPETVDYVTSRLAEALEELRSRRPCNARSWIGRSLAFSVDGK
jgi:hypothetical protein